MQTQRVAHRSRRWRRWGALPSFHDATAYKLSRDDTLAHSGLSVRHLLPALGLMLLLLVAACGGGGGSAGAEDFMKMLSDDAYGVLYVDISAVDGDDDLRDVRRDLENDWDFESYDLDLRDLDYVAFSEEEGGGDVYLLGGVDDLDDLRDELDDLDYDDDEIRGVEVWVDSSRTWEAFAFLPGRAVLIAYDEDDMEDMLRRRDRGGSSLDDDLGGVWRDLPSGFMKAVGSCSYRDCDFWGFSVEKENSREAKLVAVFEFESERDADRAADDIEDDYDDTCDDAEVRQSGSRVRAEAVCDMDTGDWDFDLP